MKCNCGSKSTGWTTIACCNICGLPIPTESWEINPDLVCGRAETVVTKSERPSANGAVAETIRIINIEINQHENGLLESESNSYKIYAKARIKILKETVFVLKNILAAASW